MRKRDRRALNEYLRWLADHVELRDWTAILNIDDPAGRTPSRADGKTWGASSESTPGRKHVVITLPEDIRDWDRDEIRQCLLHELIHAHLAPLMEMIRVDLYSQMGRPTYEVFCDGATRWMEFAVDALADVAVKSAPLIEWPA